MADEAAARPLRRLMRTIVADTTPLKVSADYRRLWLGLTISNLGQQMTNVAVAIQVFAITGSSFSVGLVGFFGLVPLIVFGLYGGAIADVVDRRLLMLSSAGGLALCSVVLLVHAVLDGSSVWLLYAVVAVQAAMFAVNNPARMATIPRLIGPDLLPAANALGQVTWGLGFTLGPLLAGALVGTVGFAWVYGIDVIAFMAALYAVLRLPPIPPEVVDGAPATKAGFASVLEGLRYVKSRKNVLMTFLIDLNAMIFGMPRALFPAVAGSFYGGGAATVGILSAAPALGALLGALFSGGLGRVRRQGRAVVVAIVVWGAAIAAFGFTRTLWLGVLFLAVAGAADMVSAVYRSTILQVATPDAMRGRLQGVFIVVVAGGPRLGDVESGTVAEVTNEAFSIVSGGLLCIGGVAVLCALYPRFLKYDARHPEP
ncbi:MAG: MFS transporter [Candidatus Nanopelagicales bacterium]